MEIDFIVRSDFHSKPGGDTVQIMSYIDGLALLGFECAIVKVSDPRRLRARSIAHLTNTARPYEFLRMAEFVGDRAYVVSPIHHSLRDVRLMRRQSSYMRGLSGWLGRSVDEASREMFAEMRRGALGRPTISLFRQRRGLWAQIGEVLNRAHAVQVLSWSERANIAMDTGWSGSNAVLVPNGYPVTASSLPSGRDRHGALVVGRVEPRKRQVEIAELASKYHVPVTFAGGDNPNFKSYGRELDNLVEQSPFLVRHSHLNQIQVLGLMYASRALINASWAEVQSLVDIEAARCGCQLLISSTGSTFEYISSARIYQHAELPAMIMDARNLSITPGLGEFGDAVYSHSWHDAARTLQGVYAAA